VLSQHPADLARQASLVEPAVSRRCVRTAVTPIVPGMWRLDVAVRDEPGLLAHQLAVLDEYGYEVVDVAIVVWPDKQSVSTFRLRGDRRPSGDSLADVIAASIPAPVRPLAVPDAELSFDNTSSPWHTICTVRTGGGRSLLATAKAFALAGVNVVGARSTVIDGATVEVFSVVEKRGTPLTDSTQGRIREILASGRVPSLRNRRTKVRSADFH
jgi:UTP:GlnB (protein PII) uridylyltransferase